MALSTPSKCTNPRCLDTAIKPIHHFSQSVAIDAVDGPPVFSHHVTYRCQQCGHTWAVQGYTSQRYLDITRSYQAVDSTSKSASRAW